MQSEQEAVSEEELEDIEKDARYTRDSVGAPGCAVRKRGDAILRLAAGYRKLLAEPPPVETYRSQVEAFHRKFGHPVRLVPHGVPAHELSFRRSLIAEEFCELLTAICGDDLGSEGDIAYVRSVLATFMRLAPIGAWNVSQIAHEIVDCIYVLEGTAAVMGVDLAPVFAEVHRANMDKNPNGPNGKPTKPVGWRAADVARVVESQRKSSRKKGKSQ